MLNKKQSIKTGIITVFLVLLFILVGNLLQETGIFQKSKIDSRDLERWEYESEYIKGAQAIELQGTKETCWLLIHSYASTPAEMTELSKEINEELGHYIKAPILNGHSQIPSKLLDQSLDTWYKQIENELSNLKSQCENVNVLGSSINSPLTLKLAKNHDLNKVFVLNSFIYMPYQAHRILPLRAHIILFTPFTYYNKKIEIAQIKSQEGKDNHIAYWNMPYKPIRKSFSFIDDSIINLNQIEEPIFIGHSKNDPTASKKSAEIIYNGVSSKTKSLNWYDNSYHVLLMDNDKNQLIQDIIDFEKDEKNK